MVGQSGRPAGQLATGDAGERPSASSSYSSSRLDLVSTQTRFWGLLSPTVTDRLRQGAVFPLCLRRRDRTALHGHVLRAVSPEWLSLHVVRTWTLAAENILPLSPVSPPSQLDLITSLAALPPSVTLFMASFLY